MTMGTGVARPLGNYAVNTARAGAAETPIAQQLQESDEVAEWFGRSAAGAWARLLSIHQALAGIVDDCIKTYVKIDLRADLSTAGKTAAFVEMRKTALGKIDDLYQTAEKQISTLDEVIAEGRGKNALPVNEQLLAEMRLTRAWNRIRLELDAESSNDGNDSLQVSNTIRRIISDAAENRDMDTIEALRQELGSWLRANDLQGLQPVIQAWISEAMAPFRSPIERAADMVEAAAQSGWRDLSGAFVGARSYVADQLGGDNASCVLPGFGGPEVLQVSMDRAGSALPSVGSY